MPENAATRYLRDHGETIDDWEGICGELANEISTPEDDIIYVEGDIPWRYHMVLFRDGLIHDAWCDGEPLPLREWLVEMFGATTYVDVSVNGEIIFEGECQNFETEEAVAA